MSAFVCPCLVCRRCGFVNDDEGMGHPIDGLAMSCSRCGMGEWWAHCGPFMDGRHIRSDSERDEWAAHDDLVRYGVRT